MLLLLHEINVLMSINNLANLNSAEMNLFIYMNLLKKRMTKRVSSHDETSLRCSMQLYRTHARSLRRDATFFFHIL